MADKIYLPSSRSPKPHQQRFSIAQPWETHYGWVSCKDYDCEQYINGWKLILSVDGQKDQIEYVRSLKDKEEEVAPGVKHRYWFTEEQNDPLLITFIFPAGQPCFKASTHKWHVRPPIWVHDRNEIRRVLKDGDFKDLMNEESYKIQHEREKG